MAVLIVDDDRDIREMLAQTLEDEGYEVLTAASGREAMALLTSTHTPPCVILLDLMMPGMNGWEFRAAQQRDPRLAAIPVVVLSARTDLPSATATMAGVHYLAKPIDFDTLMDTIARHCGDR
ncbi:MAG TPA: response regulator [Roseiflexaceae bacterium]|nr:response regulator [Roseiflexaceae bacterium]